MTHTWHYFNSRPCEGADNPDWTCKGFQYISTHGPARGPTSSFCFIFQCLSISTHGPARGPTVFLYVLCISGYISTHGPARGPTCCIPGFRDTVKDFNSRPREGADRLLLLVDHLTPYFNSRPREGADTICHIQLYQGSISTHGPARGPTLL